MGWLEDNFELVQEYGQEFGGTCGENLHEKLFRDALKAKGYTLEGFAEFVREKRASRKSLTKELTEARAEIERLKSIISLIEGWAQNITRFMDNERQGG